MFTKIIGVLLKINLTINIKFSLLLVLRKISPLNSSILLLKLLIMTIFNLRSVLFTFSVFSRVESFRQEEYYVTLIDFTELSLRFDNFHLVFEMQLRLNFSQRKNQMISTCTEA